jgi:hypothetical protein
MSDLGCAPRAHQYGSDIIERPFHIRGINERLTDVV